MSLLKVLIYVVTIYYLSQKSIQEFISKQISLILKGLNISINKRVTLIAFVSLITLFVFFIEYSIEGMEGNSSNMNTKIINEIKAEKSKGVLALINKVATIVLSQKEPELKRMGNTLLDISRFLRENPSQVQDLNEILKKQNKIEDEQIFAKVIEAYVHSRDIQDVDHVIDSINMVMTFV